MRLGSVLAAAIVAIIVGVAAYMAGLSGAQTKTVTVEKTQVVTSTVTQAAGRSALEEMILNGTFARRCVLCGMDAAEAVHMGVSAVVEFSTGVHARTDDIGCIFRMAILPAERWPFIKKLIGSNVTTAEEVRKYLGDVKEVLVPDYGAHVRGTESYIDAKKAFYVILQDRKTPMGDCVFAFSSREEAAKYNSTVYTYDQMLQLYKEVMQKTGMPRPMWCRGAGHMHGG
nr:nitrous oxide reductase accessory protein NosL [Pyrobaculum sp.]